MDFDTIMEKAYEEYFEGLAEGEEPVIIAPDYTNDELYEWMRQKINAAQDLKWANEARAKQAENLSALEQDITNLEKAAALSIARMITYPRE